MDDVDLDQRWARREPRCAQVHAVACVLAARRDSRHVAPTSARLGSRHPIALRGAAAMTAITESKTPSQNRLEGLALTALLQGLPTYATAVLAIKIMGAREIVGQAAGPLIFVVLASLFHGMMAPWLGAKFNMFRQGY